MERRLHPIRPAHKVNELLLYFTEFDLGSLTEVWEALSAENGFYPSFSRSHTEIGTGKGKGFKIRVPWEGDKCRDSDYLAVWKHILIAVVGEFNPQTTIISADFGAR
ncbi:hypothetical protein RJ640_028658 [Escallonia rubra]|uniref:Histone deacetylase domain-containing protein n=1 Tax=Escallonia rubra TaxID=112253 RepID=A0AA88QQU2_9ASTE|nr:hypothetical protein RJ640_028658 [Escallonia rubra]